MSITLFKYSCIKIIDICDDFIFCDDNLSYISIIVEPEFEPQNFSIAARNATCITMQWTSPKFSNTDQNNLTYQV